MVAAGAILGIVLGEVGARIAGFEFHPHLRNRVYFAEPDPLLGWRNRPGASGPYGGNEFRTRVTIDAHGQRGVRPHAPDRRPGTWRIAVLGDSQAWGDGVGDEESFPALLDGHHRAEVLNFGCPGYGTDQELLLFGSAVVRWLPDVVVVAVYVGNDLADNLSAGTFQYPKPRFAIDGSGRLDLLGVPVPSRPWLMAATRLFRVVMEHSALLNALAEATNGGPPDPSSRLPDEPTIYSSTYTATPGEQARVGLPTTARLIAEIVKLVRDSGARPVILLLPEIWQVDVALRPAWRAGVRAQGGDWRRPQRTLKHDLEPLRVEVVDALPALVGASRPSLRGGEHAFRRQWRHLAPLGHRVVARLLAARLGLRPDAARREPGPSPAERITINRR